ncbi:SCP-like extracellular [Agromyces badenianii]|uniref:SCP-like extracellular n=1 Tax=Agromyces badenianii TaxID=2080742 RepID=A0A2S0WT03_9MICO|nr:CAP domain-containing protein [Agromyces badenianii]AWB94421.1 SCP-like extracellular [Agromyces badenianii]
MGQHRNRASWPPSRLWLIGAGAVLLVGSVSVSAVALGNADGERATATDTAAAAAGSERENETASSRPMPTAAPAEPAAVAAPAPAPAPEPAPAPAPAPEAPAPADPPPAPAPAPSSGASSVEAEVLAIVNRERAATGCGPVSDDAGLRSVARAHSGDMAARGFFDHTNPDGQTPWDRAGAAGISHAGGENIARGQADAASVMQSWMNSPGHRANILNCDFTTLGVGVHEGPGGPWWTQLFGY